MNHNPLIVAFAALTLAACSSGGPNLYDQVGDFAVSTVVGGEAPEAVSRTRAELNEIPYATISVAVADTPRAYLVLLADNGGYLDYRDASGNAVRMLGGALSGLVAPGFDLDAVRHGSEDPIAHPRPLADWPAETWREYQFSIRDKEKFSITLKCLYQPVAREQVEIAELLFDVTRVSEICANARRSVVNSYWIDAATGFVWKSEQWGGPKLGKVSIEVIRPYAGQ